MVALTQKRLCAQYGWFSHGWSHMVMSRTMHALEYNTVQPLWHALYIFDSNKIGTKCGAIEEVNQAVKSGFELSWLSPVHA